MAKKTQRARQAKRAKQAKQAKRAKRTRQAGQAKHSEGAESRLTQSILSMGYRELSARQGGAALDTFGHIVSSDNDRPAAEAMLGSAIAYLQLGNVEGAAIGLRFAIASLIDDPAELKEIGLLYTDLGMPCDATPFLTRALVEAPEDSSILPPLASALIGSGAHDDAVRMARSAVKARPQDAEAHRVLGVAYMADMKPGKSIKSLERAVELDSDDSESLYCLAMALANVERWKESYSRFEEAAAAGSPKPLTDVGRATAPYHVGRTDEALATAENVVPLAADDIGLAHMLALFYVCDAQAPERALPLLERAAQLEPQEPGAYIRLMEITADIGDRKRFDEAYSALHDIDPDLANEIKDALTS